MRVPLDKLRNVPSSLLSLQRHEQGLHANKA